MKKSFRPVKYIALCSILLFIVLSSCASKNSIAYSPEQFNKSLEDMLYQGKTELTICYDADTFSREDAQIQLDGFLKQHYLAGCLLEDATLTVQDSGSAADVSLLLVYREEASFQGKIHEVSDDDTMRDVLADMMEKSAPKTALLLKDYSLTEDQIFDFLNEAEINCAAMPCEATGFSYTPFDPSENMQLLIIWGDYPLDENILVEKRTELDDAISDCIIQLNETRKDAGDHGEGDSENRQSYERILDFLCENAEYDQNMEIVTQYNPDQMPSTMHIDRSAYGAIVTKKTVCTGYARSFKALFDASGLPCYVIMGSCNGVTHAWNAVPLDGQTFYIDCTAADTGAAKETAFLFTPEEAKEQGYVTATSCHIPW